MKREMLAALEFATGKEICRIQVPGGGVLDERDALDVEDVTLPDGKGICIVWTSSSRTY